jgi:hypothetical protein
MGETANGRRGARAIVPEGLDESRHAISTLTGAPTSFGVKWRKNYADLAFAFDHFTPGNHIAR